MTDGFDVRFDFDDARRYAATLGTIADRQLPFALAKTLTQGAKQAVTADLPAAMKSSFDKPTPYTLRVLAFLPATKTKLHAEILPRAFAGKGNVAWKYLDPEVVGGARDAKRSEQRLKALLGEPVFLIPAKGAKLDSYGNVSKGQMTKILSGLGAMLDPAQNATARSTRKKKLLMSHGGINGSKRRVTKSPYFVVRSKSSGKRKSLSEGRPIAIYQLRGKGRVEPVLIISRRPPNYRPRFAFGPVVQKSMQASLPRLFVQNLEAAIRTAR